MKSASRFAGSERQHRAAWPSVAIRVHARYGAPPERVFDAWVETGTAAKWLFATATRPSARVAIDARVTGAFRFVEAREHGGVEHFGEYVEVAAPRRLAFSLVRSDRPRTATRVTVEIEPYGRGCKLSLAHEHVPLDLVQITETRWIGMLYGLGVTLGADARDPQSPGQSFTPEIVLPRLAPVRALPRGNAQPSTNPGSQ